MSKQRGIRDFFIASKRASDDSMKFRKKTKTTNEPDVKAIESNEKIIGMKENLSVLDANMGPSWFYALEQEFSKPYFRTLSQFVETERKSYNVYPDEDNVWAWTRMCALEEVKVVIIGQDPYHNPGQAHGLCFSVQRGVAPPPSLLNIYKELESDIPGFKKPNHGDLTKWAEQGILLLNATLTVRKNTPNSHAKSGWEKLTDAVIESVSKNNTGVVFLLWGAFAQKKAACVDKNRHHLLISVHPSPLAASRGFFGCKHFSKCNQILEEAGRQPINWSLC